MKKLIDAWRKQPPTSDAASRAMSICMGIIILVILAVAIGGIQ